MATMTSIFGELQSVRIESAPDDEGTIWIRTGSVTLCLILTAAQRDSLRYALDDADKYAKDTYVPQVAA